MLHSIGQYIKKTPFSSRCSTEKFAQPNSRIIFWEITLKLNFTSVPLANNFITIYYHKLTVW